MSPSKHGAPAGVALRLRHLQRTLAHRAHICKGFYTTIISMSCPNQTSKTCMGSDGSRESQQRSHRRTTHELRGARRRLRNVRHPASRRAFRASSEGVSCGGHFAGPVGGGDRSPVWWDGRRSLRLGTRTLQGSAVWRPDHRWWTWAPDLETQEAPVGGC